MVVVIDGINYACQSCIKGHRTAQCQHTSRPLQELQRKGRPVSQCNHCRGSRAKNNSHVKCTCAISSVPNPINGCMCHIADRCICVAASRQETQTPSPKLQTSHDTMDAAVDATLTEDKVVDDELWKAVMSDIDTILANSKAT